MLHQYPNRMSPWEKATIAILVVGVFVLVLFR